MHELLALEHGGLVGADLAEPQRQQLTASLQAAPRRWAEGLRYAPRQAAVDAATARIRPFAYRRDHCDSIAYAASHPAAAALVRADIAAADIVCELAAVYAKSLVRGPFADNNLRTALAVMDVFLRLNERSLWAGGAITAAMFRELRQGLIGERRFYEWLRRPNVCN